MKTVIKSYSVYSDLHKGQYFLFCHDLDDLCIRTESGWCDSEGDIHNDDHFKDEDRENGIITVKPVVSISLA
jgi:hypothetical protein